MAILLPKKKIILPSTGKLTSGCFHSSLKTPAEKLATPSRVLASTRITPATFSKKFYDIERDGITQGLLYNWLECRQAARWFLTGWSSRAVGMGMTYGIIVHGVLELAYLDIQMKRLSGIPNAARVKLYIKAVERQWHKENPMADKPTLQKLETSLLIAEATLPFYFDYWKKDLRDIAWKTLENEFSMPYTLPDGRKTRLRGKMDGVYTQTNKLTALFETKSKSRIEEEDILDMLPFELQVNIYLLVLRWMEQKRPAGVLYNIIRRIGLEQGKKESVKEYSNRCVADILKRPQFYFVRMNMPITDQDMFRFEAEMQDMLTDFYDWFQGKAGHYKNPGACIGKYGRCKYLNACSSGGKMAGYAKREVVFRELEDNF